MARSCRRPSTSNLLIPMNTTSRRHSFPRAAAIPALAALLAGSVFSPDTVAAVNAVWHGDAQGEGIWGDASAWSPTVVPNNGNGGNTYNVTITHNPNGNGFNGPDLTLNVTVDNLTLIDRAAVNGGIPGGPGNPGYSLTVLGTTQFNVATAGQDTGIIQAANSTFTLGTLANYNAATHTLTSGGLSAYSDSGGPGTVRWHGADIVTNNGFIGLTGVNANLRNQDNGVDALAHLATNNGSLQLINGHVLSTAGNFTNNGFISLDRFTDGAPTTVLRVNGNLTNSGTLFVQPGAQLVVTGSVANSGTLAPAPGGGVRVSGNLNVTSGGQFDLGSNGTSTFDNPQLVADRLILAQGTTLLGTGFISANTTAGGIIAPGNSPGTINFLGSLTFQSASELQMQIGGRQPGTDYDQIVQSGDGTVFLSGGLTLTLINGFEQAVTAADTFDLLHSDHPLLGNFDNVASGSRLATADGLGSFLVTYNGSDVILSQFQPVPEPSAGFFVLGGLGLLLLGRRVRRRTL